MRQKNIMLQVNIKEEDRAIFAIERYEHIHPRVCKRMDALHLKSKGLPNHQICNILDVCPNALLGYRVLRIYALWVHSTSILECTMQAELKN